MGSHAELMVQAQFARRSWDELSMLHSGKRNVQGSHNNYRIITESPGLVGERYGSHEPDSRG
jgi:hypothetical protein